MSRNTIHHNSHSSRSISSQRMGLGASNMGGTAPSHRPEPLQRRRRPSIGRSISSFVLCGTSSRVMEEDCPAELILATPAEIVDGERLEDRRKCSMPHFRGKGIDSASVSGAEIANFDDAKDRNNMTARYSSGISGAPSSSNHLHSHGSREFSIDEVSAGNIIADYDDCNSEDSSSSIFSDSPMAFHLMQDNNLQGVMPSTAEFIEPESEQNMQEGGLLQSDLMGAYSNIFLSNSVEINGNSMRNYRRSFSISRNPVLSTDEYDYSRSLDSRHHHFNGDFHGDSLQGSFVSRGIGNHGSNELGRNSRSEFWETLRSSLDSPTDVCPRRIHGNTSCICLSGLPAEESGSSAVSRVVLLAQTLFEVLDQIHQQPASLSLSTVSLPAPESHVDSLPVKIHRKENILGCAEDVSQCHICLDAYEEGDKIRVLPCQHEYHMSCVDKWLKEIHGVCPLCRRDVCKSSTEASCLNLEIHPH